MSNRRRNKYQLSVLLCLMSAATTPIATADHFNHSKGLSLGETPSEKELNNCLMEEDEPEPQCKTPDSDAPAFDTKPMLNISEQIDVRPETCESYFDDYLHTRRGLRIEKALGTTLKFTNHNETVATFPVIDFFKNNSAHVIKSKDLSAQIYTSEATPTPLFDSIITDAEDIENRFFNVLAEERSIVASVQGKTTSIKAGDITDLDLHIVVQASMATATQINQIALAEKEVKRRWGFRLKIIEIP